MVTPLPGPIGREPARQLARRELAKAEYQQHQTFPGWLSHLLERLFNSASVSVPGGWWAIVALIALALIIAAFVLARIGPVAMTRRGESHVPLDDGSPLTAQQHRDLAARLAAENDYSGAITEALRAIAADLEERGILAPERGRTADELASQAGQILPAAASQLAAAARLFDDVRYGGGEGDQAGYAQLTELDRAVRAARPAAAAAPAPAAPELAGRPS